MQDVAVTAASAGPYTVKVRHATDDGTGLTAASGTVTLVESVIELDSFSVANVVTLSAALTEAQIDAAYVAAIAAAVDVNTVAKDVNIEFSARQSNAIRSALRSNAITASANGCNGRIACLRPPLGTTKTVAISSSQPGCVPYRSDRVAYNYPGAQVYVSSIARVGVSGGTGFVASGLIDVGSDGVCAGLMSQLAPEENPGQTTTYTSGVLGLESSVNVQGFALNDYTAFKAAGICALKIEDGVAVFQSGVVDVDPVTYPSLKNIARRRFADYLQDTLARRLNGYSKKLNTFRRRSGIQTEIISFLEPMLGKTNPDAQRLDSYSVDAKSGNTPSTLAAGLFRIIVNVRTLPSLDSIVLQTTIGESVVVTAV
jgi:hypothetical protein